MSPPRFALLATLLLAATALAAPAPPQLLPLTPVGDTVAAVLSECGLNGLDHAGWTMCYRLEETRVQGLELYAVRYQGVQAFFEVGFPFSITKYHANRFGPYKDTLGTPRGNPGYGNGALFLADEACPRFLPQGELDATGKVCIEHMDGPAPRMSAWSRFDISNYRMVQGYHFHADGTFQPFVLLGGTLIDADYPPCAGRSGSACLPHFHHLYWRFDADVGDAGNDRIQEFRHLDRADTGQRNRTAPACPTTLASWCTIATESGRLRDFAASTRWRVVDFDELNANGTPRSIELIPGGISPADTVSTHDAWALRHVTGREYGYEVRTNPFHDGPVNAYAADAAALDPADVVLWYSEKVYHEPRDEEKPTMMHHAAGPTLRVRNWLPDNNVERTYP